MPLAGTIAVVTLVTAYIPFIGAVVAGAFAVLLALGTQGTTTALIMLVIVILANGMLQNIVSPIAMGATLEMNPLLILVVTISAGAFFGTAGMVLAAPLTSAAIHISSDLARVRAAATGGAGHDSARRSSSPADQAAGAYGLERVDLVVARLDDAPRRLGYLVPGAGQLVAERLGDHEPRLVADALEQLVLRIDRA